MKTLALINQKGGVGKSAIATQFAHYLHRLGHSVLVIDLDHQGNTSRPLGASDQVRTAEFTASSIFESCEAPRLPDASFVVVPGDDRLTMLERQADMHNLFAGRYRAALKTWNHFDICVVDTNPNPDIRYASALISAQYVLAPVQLNQEAIAAIAGVLGHPRYGVLRIAATLNTSLVFLGILPNLVEPTPFQRGNLENIVSKYGGRLLSCRDGNRQVFGFINKRTAIAEAQAAGVFIPDLGKTSARDTWREVKPVFDMIRAAMGLAQAGEAGA